eukprot:TRINITY_DN29848_c0_g1_i1.p1 TRINITY_DN29848_c0_g1~~TRINITY_DN29848_c0_g1_i1.p1  ORF type:complete len:135 (+),score=39.93 TRINITY_DN29848_c0_g1_i1:28-432(+)
MLTSIVLLCLVFFFKQKTAYEMLRSLVGSEMCIRDRYGDNNVQILSPRIAAFFIAQNLPQLYYNGSTVEIMTNTVAVSGGTGKNCGFSLDYWANGAVMTASLNSRIIVEGNVIQMNSTGGSINGISLGLSLIHI